MFKLRLDNDDAYYSQVLPTSEYKYNKPSFSGTLFLHLASPTWNLCKNNYWNRWSWPLNIWPMFECCWTEDPNHDQTCKLKPSAQWHSQQWQLRASTQRVDQRGSRSRQVCQEMILVPEWMLAEQLSTSPCRVAPADRNSLQKVTTFDKAMPGHTQRYKFITGSGQEKHNSLCDDIWRQTTNEKW